MKDIKFVGLHAHSGVGSPFDGFGYPQEHMDYCFDNGGKALALTDHGNVNGLAYQILHAKKMKKEGYEGPTYSFSGKKDKSGSHLLKEHWTRDPYKK